MHNYDFQVQMIGPYGDNMGLCTVRGENQLQP